MKLPPYNSFPTISGDKISLRQILPADIKYLIEISYYDSIRATSLSEATAMHEKIEGDYRNGNTIHWGITEDTKNTIIGTCGYYRGFDNEAGELGCILLPQFRGRGLMTPALQLAIDFGLNYIGLKRIRAITTRQNYKAIKLLDRLKFIKTADLDSEQTEFELRTIV